MDDIRNAKFGLNNPSKHAEKLVKDVRSTSQAEGENAIKVVLRRLKLTTSTMDH